MEISEVKVKLVGERNDRLKAFCSITVDREFVIRDLKVIEGTSGMFVAMPSRKITDRCPKCGGKNHLRAKFCSECGVKLNETRAGRDIQGRTKLHADIAHPINSGCRERMQKSILKSYEEECERAKAPGYKRGYDEDLDDVDLVESETADSPSHDLSPSTPSPQERGSQPPESDRNQQNNSFGAGIL